MLVQNRCRIKKKFRKGVIFTEGQFYKLPQAIFSEKYSGISSDAKLLYSLMLDRVKLSEMNGWRDESGRVYIIFTREEACRVLGFGKDKAARVYSELETAGLITQKKQYLARPTLIYVNDISARESSSPCDENGGIRTAENTVSESSENGVQNADKNAAIKTYHNQKENSQPQNIKTYPSQTVGGDVTGNISSTNLKERLNESLEIEMLKARYPMSAGSLGEIRDIIADVMLCRRRVTFEGKVVPENAAAERFGRLTSDNICMVLDALAETESDIRRIDAYIATALYGTTFTVSSRNEVGWRVH